MAQRSVEAATVPGQHGIESGFDRTRKPAVMVGSAPQKTRAQHWGKRQGYDRGDHDRRRDRDGEFAEQASEDAAHEQQRNENRSQRKTYRQHREANFARPDQRGL